MLGEVAAGVFQGGSISHPFARLRPDSCGLFGTARKHAGGKRKRPVEHMAAATAPPANGLTKNFDKAREDYARAQEQMLATAAELDRLQKELQRSQQSVLERERAMMEV